MKVSALKCALTLKFLMQNCKMELLLIPRLLNVLDFIPQRLMYVHVTIQSRVTEKNKPLSETEMVSVLCFSLIASEEGEIIDYSFYHEEHVFMCILIINVMHNWVHHIERKGEGVMSLKPYDVLRPHLQTEVSPGICTPPGCSVDTVPVGSPGPSKVLLSSSVFSGVGSRWPQMKERPELWVVSAHSEHHLLSWLLTVSISLLALKVHTPAECVSFQICMCINLIFS